MKNIVVVGPQSTLGHGVTIAYAKKCGKIALICWNNCDTSDNKSIKSLKKKVEEENVELKKYSIDLSKKKEWELVVEEVRTFFNGKLDLLLYFDGVYAHSNLLDTELSECKLMMKRNFVVPVIGISTFLPLLQKSKGQISIMASVAAGRGAPGTTLYSASKRALESYLKNISTQTGIVVTFVYPGVTDSHRTPRQGRKRQAEGGGLDTASFGSIRDSIDEKRSEIVLAERKVNFTCHAKLYPEPSGFDPEDEEIGDLSKAVFYPDRINELKVILKGFKHNPDMLFETDSHGRTPFHYAAFSGNISGFELINGKLRKKSVLNQGDEYKWTPLHYAARNGHLRMVRRLIRENGDPNCLTQFGYSPLHFLSRFEPPSDHKFAATYIHTLKACVEIGADTNQRNADWFTPVHEAAANGCPTALTFLLKNEGDPHRKTKSGQQTPLSYAVRSGCEKVVQILLHAGADPYACFDYAPEEYQSLLEKYREKNCRPESDTDDTHKEIIIIRSIDDFPPAARKIIESSGVLHHKKLVEDNWRTFLYVLRFLTRKIYRTPEEFAENPGPEPKREFKSRTLHNKSLEEISEELITNGNPRKMFKVVEDVGRGGFGSVVMVKRLEDKKQVAIKKVPHLSEKEQWSNLDEVYFLQQCKHDCVVKYHNAYLTRDEMWMVMEFLEGGSLSQAVAKFHLQESQICYVTKEILRGLASFHKKGIAHRDLKSANIMLSVNGDIKIIDFGLCVELGSVETRNMVGSPFWIPPEMIQRKEHGTAADIWSLAILCLEMAYGKPPHRRSALKAMFYAGSGVIPKLVDSEHITWSDEFRDFLSKMLVVDPNERATAEELLQHSWMEQADTRNGMAEILHHIFVEKSLEQSLGIV